MKASIHWGRFVWDQEKEQSNVFQHGLDFKTAAKAFLDPDRQIYEDEKHSAQEPRWYCIGQTEEGIITVRFTRRGKMIRIIGAGYWRKGRKDYETFKKARP